jgi:hypothetical protein
MLFSLPNAVGIRCPRDGEHVFKDTEEILKFRKIQVAPQADKIQVNQTVMQVTIPAELKRSLEAKFGIKLQATLNSLMQIAMLPRIVFLMEEDVQRIEAQIGQPIKSGAQLFGAFFAEKKKAEENEEELTQMRKTVTALRGASPTSVLVDLKDQLPNAIAKSRESGKTLEEYASEFLFKAFENNWTE